MERREFVKNLGLLGLGLATMKHQLFGSGLFHSWKAQWKNWLWMGPEKGLSDEDWKKKLEVIKNYGFDAILLQVYSGNTAWFNSEHLIVEEVLLERIARIGKETGIEVHAWTWNMPNNNPYYIEKHPDWYAVNRNGDPSWSHPAYVGYYKFMCPNNPEVRAFLSENVKQLAAIEQLDGIHLDYIRLPDVIIAKALQPVYNIVQDREYPEYDYCYCPICREKFKNQTGLDPLKDFKDPSLSIEWRNFRYRSVTELVNDHLAPEARKKNKFISAAVFPNWESVRQQWHTWDLDAFFPMLYHNFYDAPLEWIGEQIYSQMDKFLIPKPIYAGLYLEALQGKDFSKALKISKEAGASGIALFSYNHLTDIHINSLHEINER